MEAGQIEISSSNGNPATPPGHALIPRADPAPNPSAKKKKKLKVNNPIPQETTKPPSVSSCYVFKSRLQEYAQKAGLTTPVYETLKEGPSHEPSFKSTVIVNNVRYDSLPGFFNRKAAEQSAAEVALLALSNSVDTKFGISAPVHETGLCKNLLQEYAQKMNYAMPLYECHKEENQGRISMYSCTAEIGGIRYIGAAASTKKEAEIKAARTALLAIQSAATNPSNNSTYSVVPQKKKGSDLGISTQETSAALKPKKGRFKKQQRRKQWRALKRQGQGVLSGGSEVNMNGQGGVKSVDANMDGCAGAKLGGGLEVNVEGRVGLESVVSEGVSCQHNTADGSGVNTNGWLVVATSVVESQGTDPGVGGVETSSSGVCIGNPENALVACNERRPKDAQSLTTDVHS